MPAPPTVLPVTTAGATTLNVPDTVGYTTPDEIFDLFRFLSNHVDRSPETIFSAHAHDDLGMAVANSLAKQIAAAGGMALVTAAQASAPSGDNVGAPTRRS